MDRKEKDRRGFLVSGLYGLWALITAYLLSLPQDEKPSGLANTLARVGHVEGFRASPTDKVALLSVIPFRR